jgi:hypothetical protein
VICGLIIWKRVLLVAGFLRRLQRIISVFVRVRLALSLRKRRGRRSEEEDEEREKTKKSEKKERRKELPAVLQMMS